MLTPDPELSDVGSVTKIPYAVDYAFYLQRLFKRSRWANDVMDLFNREVFGQTTASAVVTPLSSSHAPARSWEDELLDQMDSENLDIRPGVQVVNIPSISVNVSSTTPNAAATLPAGVELPRARNTNFVAAPAPAPTPVPAAQPVPAPDSDSDLEIQSQRRAASVALSTTSQLQADLGQMSISGTRNASVPQASARRVTTRKVMPVHPTPALVAVADIQDNEMPLDCAHDSERLPVQVQPTAGRATRARTSKTKNLKA